MTMDIAKLEELRALIAVEYMGMERVTHWGNGDVIDGIGYRDETHEQIITDWKPDLDDGQAEEALRRSGLEYAATYRHGLFEFVLDDKHQLSGIDESRPMAISLALGLYKGWKDEAI
jgi:hypothetical protein